MCSKVFHSGTVLLEKPVGVLGCLCGVSDLGLRQASNYPDQRGRVAGTRSPMFLCTERNFRLQIQGKGARARELLPARSGQSLSDPSDFGRSAGVLEYHAESWSTTRVPDGVWV